ncbi:hypothetical protein WQE_37287 [Paraburkholderia hospita]|uniref:Uncharacterized protein n=1 Tax=Paraburkholderia hospita TaxID=169430 RepID=A0ABN0FAX7_9BURK|nr:hypothetical protein WQE_37287 [Paraburkholderia hospita]
MKDFRLRFASFGDILDDDDGAAIRHWIVCDLELSTVAQFKVERVALPGQPGGTPFDHLLSERVAELCQSDMPDEFRQGHIEFQSFDWSHRTAPLCGGSR